MKQVIAFDGQSFQDLSVQEYGTAEGLFGICDANGVEPDDLPNPGQVYKIPVFDGAVPEMVARIQKKGIVPNTLASGPDQDDIPPEDAPEGINYWGIEEDFVVQENPIEED